MAELILRNAFRVRSLKVDYSGNSLLNLPFTNLTRFRLDCRCSFIKYPVQDGIVTVEKDQQFKENALKLIAQNPRLQEVDISYTEILAYTFARDSPLPPFAIRAFQAFQQHRRQSSLSLSNNSDSSSGLHSLKLVRYGNQSLEDICSIIKNCPSSLKELTLHSHYMNCRPIPVCNSDLQDLYLPNGVVYRYSSDRRLNSNSPDAALISTLVLNCQALTTVNFGENLIAEEQMFRFVKVMPEPLQELTMKIESDYLGRVFPALLRRSGPALQVLRLDEYGFDDTNVRSTYIADILATCPRLKTLAIWPPWRSHTESQGTNVGLQDLLRAEWACSGLEALSISSMDLTEYKAEQEMDKDKDRSSAYNADSGLAFYLRKIHNVTEFLRRLKVITPSLQNLSLAWSYLCHDIHTTHTAMILRWMNLKWSPFYGGGRGGLSSTSLREAAVQRQLEKERDLVLQRKLQSPGISVCEFKMGITCTSGAAYGRTTGGGGIQTIGNAQAWLIHRNTMTLQPQHQPSPLSRFSSTTQSQSSILAFDNILITDNISWGDVSSIIENCPPSLQELVV
ncbi:hypothetical protein BG015_007585 [Linnemannia schmuckeri]|uniref:Uncharacterized protein n=1 Tax=Linnemannia schmuckeri TaxID=64567 RepID=A0A9P5S6P6_9FUNG|nr:hypothetical protein BG015_007585 [Linnemannia schmuckeri]